MPPQKDWESFRDIFEEAQNDKDFKIFTHSEVSIERMKIGKDTIVITGNAAVINSSKEDE